MAEKEAPLAPKMICDKGTVGSVFSQGERRRLGGDVVSRSNVASIRMKMGMEGI